jgi:predicted phosphodiesterase
MAVYGVLGDIHGNKEALAEVLRALSGRGVQEILCVGDVVGYNADPDECVQLLRARSAACIAGNHDLIALGRLGFERCSNKARYSLQRTRRALAPHTAAWLAAQPASRLVEDAIVLVHGGARDVQLYMRTPEHIRQNAALMLEDFPLARICFFGHSHEQRLFQVGQGVAEVAACGVVRLSRESLYFINPGAVDAQRKHAGRHADFAIFDSGRWTVEFLSVPYDAAATEAKARAAGYRIGAITDLAYSVRRRTARLLE